MAIYINKNNQQSGPFEESEVVDQLRNGLVSPDDMAIRRGDAAWQRLGDMFPDVARRNEPAAAVNAAGAAVPLTSSVAETPAAKGGGCKNVAGIILMVFGVLALLGGAGMAIATPYIYTTPSCDFAESDWKKIEDLKKKYDAAKGTSGELGVEAELEVALAGHERSSKLCAEQKSTMKTFQIGEGAVAVVGLLMLIVGFVVRRL